MTINEKKQLTEYVKGLVRESISGEMPRFYNDAFGPHKDLDDEDETGFHDDNMDDDEEMFAGNDEINADREEDDNWGPDGSVYGDDEDDDMDNIAGINELRALTESMARNAVKSMLMEKEKEKSKKKKSSDKKKSSSEKTIMDRLNNDAVNAAHYFYKLYGVEDGTEAEKAAARSKGYKKANGKKNDTGVPYKFSSKERNRLNAMLTTDKN